MSKPREVLTLRVVVTYGLDFYDLFQQLLVFFAYLYRLNC